jgi:hypothetical protein
MAPIVEVVDDGIAEQLRNAYAKDDMFSLSAGASAVAHGCIGKSDGFWYKDGRLAVPADDALKAKLLASVHAAGHLGMDRTLSMLRERFRWPHMAEDVAEYVNSCPRCQAAKPLNVPSAQPLQPLPAPAQLKSSTVTLQ